MESGEKDGVVGRSRQSADRQSAVRRIVELIDNRRPRQPGKQLDASAVTFRITKLFRPSPVESIDEFGGSKCGLGEQQHIELKRCCQPQQMRAKVRRTLCPCILLISSQIPEQDGKHWYSAVPAPLQKENLGLFYIDSTILAPRLYRIVWKILFPIEQQRHGKLREHLRCRQSRPALMLLRRQRLAGEQRMPGTPRQLFRQG